MREKIGFTSNQLKWIALFFMTIDHIAVYLIDIPIIREHYHLLRAIGRIAAPLFLFMTVVGLWHTRSKFRYALRLYLASITMEFLNFWFGKGIVDSNIFQSLFYVVFYVYLIEELKQSYQEKNRLKTIGFGVGILVPVAFLPLQIFANHLGFSTFEIVIRFCVNCFLPNPFAVEYSVLFIIIGIVSYYLKNQYKISIFFAICCLLSYLGRGYIPYNPYIRCYVMFTSLQYWMFLALPFILLYNGKKGKNLKWVFYVYYPLHQYVFAFSAIWINKYIL